MFSYIIRRILYAVPILFGVMVITFILFYIVHTPQSMALRMLGPKASQQAINNWIHNRGYDKAMFVDLSDTGIGAGYAWTVKYLVPTDVMKQKLVNFALPLTPAGRGRSVIDTQFFNHLISFAMLDLGKADATGEPIVAMFKRGAIPSLMITFPAFLLGIIMAVLAALFLVLVRESLLDVTGTILCVISMSIPIMVYVIFGQWLFANQFRYVPGYGFVMGGLTMLKFIALPVCIMAFAGIGSDIRMYRAIFLEEARNDYVRTAHAKGLSAQRVLLVHVLKNGLISLITLVVAALPLLIMGSIVIEDFFGIPGLGNLMINAIRSADFSVIMAEVYVGSLLFLLGLLLTDICYAFADPRIRLS